MNNSLLAVLDNALARLPETLADDAARRGVRRVAAALPGSLAEGPLGLEIRLAGGTRVDVFAAASPGAASFCDLIASLDGVDSARRWSNPQRADDVATVLRRWQDGHSALNSVARYLLLEADAPTDSSPTASTAYVAVPSIFLAPRAPRDAYRPGQPPNAFHRNIIQTVQAAAELSDVWPDSATAEQLAAVVEVLHHSPDVATTSHDGDIFAVGAMVSRAAGAALRIAIRRITLAEMHTILYLLGRPRQAETLANWVSDTVADHWALACDIGPGAESRVGIELATAHAWQRADPTGWPELFAEAVARGVAIPERAAAGMALIDRHAEPLWGLAHIKVAADEHGLLPIGKLYVGLRCPSHD